MKKRIANISKIVLWIIILIAIGYGTWHLKGVHDRSLYSGLDITIYDEGLESLTDTTAIRHIVEHTSDSLHEIQLKEIPLRKIEQALRAEPVIEEVDVYTNLNGRIKVKVKTYKPLVRIFTGKGKSFYIDRSGFMLPTVTGHSAHVIFASGHFNLAIPDSLINNNYQIKNLKRFSVLQEIFNLAAHLEANTFLRAQIDQIYLNSANEFELTPKIGDQSILLGNSDNIERKLKKLEAFYKQAMPVNGWNKYKSINLKYKNQVVCSKL
ncbi:MAG TPA: hypothetical protein VJ939_09130 [Bacteroidales bacterium]|nr:hypothetical protein [Bacteroidales bacterium]